MTNLLAAVLVLEAANQGRIGMEAVHEVIHNRACALLEKKSDYTYNEAVYKILTKPKQFSCLNNLLDTHAITKAQKDRHAYYTAWAIIKSPMTRHVGRATHYHTRDIRPKWALDSKRMKFIVTIGDHMFYEEIKK